MVGTVVTTVIILVTSVALGVTLAVFGSGWWFDQTPEAIKSIIASPFTYGLSKEEIEQGYVYAINPEGGKWKVNASYWESQGYDIRNNATANAEVAKIAWTNDMAKLGIDVSKPYVERKYWSSTDNGYRVSEDGTINKVWHIQYSNDTVFEQYEYYDKTVKINRFGENIIVISYYKPMEWSDGRLFHKYEEEALALASNYTTQGFVMQGNEIASSVLLYGMCVTENMCLEDWRSYPLGSYRLTEMFGYEVRQLTMQKIQANNA